MPANSNCRRLTEKLCMRSSEIAPLLNGGVECWAEGPTGVVADLVRALRFRDSTALRTTPGAAAGCCLPSLSKGGSHFRPCGVPPCPCATLLPNFEESNSFRHRSGFQSWNDFQRSQELSLLSAIVRILREA